MAFIRSGGFRVLLLLTVVLTFAVGAVGGAFYLSLIRDLPDLQSIEDYQPPLTTQVLDRHGRVVAEFYQERRQLASMDSIPRHTRLAFVAAEDKGFYEHKGIDYTSILRAAIANARAGGAIKQGASTITQQTVKSLLLTPERTYRRKFREMILARKIEQYLSKDEILYLYLNQIYFGSGAWGIAEAARTYFDKPVEELTVSESALLAGLPQRPNAWHPFRDPEAADKRRRYVLGRMLEDEIIDPATYEEALADVPVATSPSRDEDFEVAAYFTELVRRHLFDRLGGDAVLTGGLTIETTLDLDLQRTAVAAVKAGLEAQDHRAGYRGPLRRVSKEEIEAEILKIAEENGLVEPEPEVEETPQVELAEAPIAIPPTAPRETAEEIVADARPPADEAETPAEPEPTLPFDERLLGVVVAVDTKAQTARIAFAPDLEGQVLLEDVSWARTSDPVRRARPVKKIAKVFAVGDVARFVRGDEPDESAAEAEAGEESEPTLPRVTLHQEPMAQGALLSLAVDTGDVEALVGGYDYATSQFNRVTQALRQPGSAFKPLIYGAALARGYTPVEILYDRPIVYQDPISGFKYKPQNYERRFFGPVPMRFALAHSINNATVHLFRDVGVDYVIDYARRLGIESPLSRDLSLAIGSSSLTLLELTRAYAIFPNAGRRVTPRFITQVLDRDGVVLVENVALGDAPPPSLTASEASLAPGAPGTPPVSAADPDAEPAELAVAEEEEAEQVVSPEVAYLMCDLLKAVVTEGTGRRLLSLNRPLAGKTGTTNDFADAWFMGFSPDVVTGVWVGHDQAAVRLGWGESGARAALPIWKQYMAASLAGRPARDFDAPDQIVFERIDRKTGLLADSQTEDAYFQPFEEGNVPTETTGSVSHSSDTQRALRSDAF